MRLPTHPRRVATFTGKPVSEEDASGLPWALLLARGFSPLWQSLAIRPNYPSSTRRRRGSRLGLYLSMRPVPVASPRRREARDAIVFRSYLAEWSFRDGKLPSHLGRFPLAWTKFLRHPFRFPVYRRRRDPFWLLTSFFLPSWLRGIGNRRLFSGAPGGRVAPAGDADEVRSSSLPDIPFPRLSGAPTFLDSLAVWVLLRPWPSSPQGEEPLIQPSSRSELRFAAGLSHLPVYRAAEHSGPIQVQVPESACLFRGS